MIGAVRLAATLPSLRNVLSRLLLQLPEVASFLPLEVALGHGHVDERLFDTLAHALGATADKDAAVDGRVFVCGSSKGMGEGVEEALIDVAMAKGNLEREEAGNFWQLKKEAGQYIAETW